MGSVAGVLACLLGCGEVPVPCESATVTVSRSRLTEVVRNECELPSFSASALHCDTLINEWSDDSECNHAAGYICANELRLVVVVDDGWTSGRYTLTRAEPPCVTAVAFDVIQ